jgi:hypothetical protein
MQPRFTLLFIAAITLIGCGDGMGQGLPAAPGLDGRDANTPDVATQDATGTTDVGSIDTGMSDAVIGDTGMSDAGSDAAHLPTVCVSGGAHSGSRWQDLYACYFGPTGIANCAFNGSCHVDPPTNFWSCGTSKDSCYQGLTSSGVFFVPDGGMMDPTTTSFYNALRTVDMNGVIGGGLMPGYPLDGVFFTPDDMSRIAAWIKLGAPNN